MVSKACDVLLVYLRSSTAWAAEMPEMIINMSISGNMLLVSDELMKIASVLSTVRETSSKNKTSDRDKRSRQRWP